jgi:3-phenylpropionate/cinnamic acid dioxygenase small subunit
MVDSVFALKKYSKKVRAEMGWALGSRKCVLIAWPSHSLDLSQAKQLKAP